MGGEGEGHLGTPGVIDHTVPDTTEGKPNQEAISNGNPGAPLGRELALSEILSKLKRAGIRNHVWLTTDVHYTAAHHNHPDRAVYNCGMDTTFNTSVVAQLTTSATAAAILASSTRSVHPTLSITHWPRAAPKASKEPANSSGPPNAIGTQVAGSAPSS